MIPDPSELDMVEKNLLILDDCFLGAQNKTAAYYTRVGIIIVIPFTYHRITLDYHRQEKIPTLLYYFHKIQKI